VEAWDCSILLEVLINGVVKNRGQRFPLNCFELARAMASASSVTQPIRNCRNSVFAHTADMQLPEQKLQQETAKLRPTLLKMHAKLHADFRPFKDAQIVMDAILTGKGASLVSFVAFTAFLGRFCLLLVE